MQRQQLVEEIKTLMDLVARNTTSLADSVMEIDVNEYTDPQQFQREKTRTVSQLSAVRRPQLHGARGRATTSPSTIPAFPS